MNDCSFQKVSWQSLGWFLSYHWKTLFLRSFILKSKKKAKVLVTNSTRDFQNSPPFERLACFYLTISGNF